MKDTSEKEGEKEGQIFTLQNSKVLSCCRVWVVCYAFHCAEVKGTMHFPVHKRDFLTCNHAGTKYCKDDSSCHTHFNDMLDTTLGSQIINNW